jgi:hypothetical protein
MHILLQVIAYFLIALATQSTVARFTSWRSERRPTLRGGAPHRIDLSKTRKLLRAARPGSRAMEEETIAMARTASRELRRVLRRLPHRILQGSDAQ